MSNTEGFSSYWSIEGWKDYCSSKLFVAAAIATALLLLLQLLKMYRRLHYWAPSSLLSHHQRQLLQQLLGRWPLLLRCARSFPPFRSKKKAPTITDNTSSSSRSTSSSSSSGNSNSCYYGLGSRSPGDASSTSSTSSSSDSSDNELFSFDYKMVLCVRQDLNMGKGKIAAQCGHATLGAYMRAQRKENKNLTAWQMSGQKKIALKIKDEVELQELHRAARAKGLNVYAVHDAGRTQVPCGSLTVLAIGPGPSTLVDQVTGHLKLL